MKTFTRTLQFVRNFYWLPLLFSVAACQSAKPTPGMKLGKPYVVDGKTYYPEYDPSYDKIGMASWYGPGFHGKYTASGEVYNQNDLTAAHPTLPMPSLVRVTNLTNGKSLILRINDRGPFKSNRIIDLSKKAAHEIGMPSTAEVRVQFLKKETEEYIASTLSKDEKLDMASYNASVVKQRNSSIINSTEPSDQVVETTVSSTHTGQTINNAAPIVTVNSDELKKPDDKTSETQAPESAIAAADLTSPKLTKTKETQPKQAAEVKITGLSNMTSPPVADSLVPKKSSPPTAKAKVEVSGSPPSAFYIQAGSFASEDNAHKLSSKLETIAKIETGKVVAGEKTWWRVRLGPFSNKEEATEALGKVHESGLPDARIVHQ